MRNATSVLGMLVLSLVGCGAPSSQVAMPTVTPRCECGVNVTGGRKMLACGTSECVDGAGYLCVGNGQLNSLPQACAAVQPVCTPKTCTGVGAVCGSISDGCSGTLNCGTCASGQQCSASGQCVSDACGPVKAVCGTVSGQNCGTCPGTSVCSANHQQCIEKLGALAFSSYTVSAVIAGDRLFVSGPSSSGTNAYDLIEFNVSTRQQRTVGTALPSLSPLATNATHLFYATLTGVKRVALGSTTQETLSGINGVCNQLLVDSRQVFCAYGGNPRYGVESFGVTSIPVAGGTPNQTISYLNYPHLAKVENLLFHVGTTDNYSIHSVLSVTDLNDMSSQSLVSGGAVNSKFMRADREAYYFVSTEMGGRSLNRVPLDNSPEQVLAVSTRGFTEELTVANVTDVWTVAEINGVAGLYRLPLTGGPEKVADITDLGGDISKVSALLKSGNGWLVIAGVDVYRVSAP